MRKLLLAILCTGGLVACSSNSEPPKQNTIVLQNCNDAHNLVKSNGVKIGQAFAARDANTIGALELQNRDIVDLNPQCFPKLQKQIKYWKKLHQEALSE